MAIMPSLVTAGKQLRCGAPRLPGELDREIEVGLILGLRQGMVWRGTVTCRTVPPPFEHGWDLVF